jgi:transposase
MLQRQIMKQVESLPGKPLFIGLDVHKSSIHAAIHGDGRKMADWRTSSDNEALAGQLLPLKPRIASIAYEAGPTGFSLARVLKRHGFQVVVCAPAHTPRTAVRQNKSDKIDAVKLARFCALGMLTPVAVPTEQEEQDRFLVRHRNALADKRRRVKQQIQSELLFTGERGVVSWSRKEIDRLAGMPCPEGQRFVLDSMLRELDVLDGEIRLAEARIQAVMKERHAKAKGILESHPGIGALSAAHFALELFSPERFHSGGAVAKYLGLSPGLCQTGESARPQPLLKTGQSRLRSQLVEAAWRWIRLDPAARSVYGRLLRNTGNANKAIAGMARRLAVRLWTMLVRGEKYDSRKGASTDTQAKDLGRVTRRIAMRAESAKAGDAPARATGGGKPARGAGGGKPARGASGGKPARGAMAAASA